MKVHAMLAGAVIGLFVWNIFVAYRLTACESKVDKLKRTLDENGIYL